jgi:NADH-quinone oxidoreductase subunit E
METEKATGDTCRCRERVGRVLGNYNGSPDSLISILQDIQAEFRYVPEKALREVAEKLGLPLVQVYGVATFFKAFSLEPRGKHVVQVCTGTACHIRGAPAVLAELERQLGVQNGETTEDQKFTLETVNCVGACALGPTVAVGETYHGQMNAGKVKELLRRCE